MTGPNIGNMYLIQGDLTSQQSEGKKKATNCPDINEFAGYLDGKLDEKDSSKVEQHMAKCPPCRTNFYEVRMLLDTVPQDTPEGLADNVKKNLQSIDAPTEGRKIKV